MEKTPMPNDINEAILTAKQHNIKHVTHEEVKLQVTPDNLNSIFSMYLKTQWKTFPL